MKDIELLQYVHETAEMGILGLQDIVGQVQTAKLKKIPPGADFRISNHCIRGRQALAGQGHRPKGPQPDGPPLL